MCLLLVGSTCFGSAINKVKLVYHSKKNPTLYDFCKSSEKKNVLNDIDVLKCIEDKEYRSAIFEQGLRDKAVGFSSNLSIIKPREDVSGVQELATEVPNQNELLMLDFWNKKPKGAIYKHTGRLSYQTDEYIKNEYNNNMFSYDTRVTVQITRGNKQSIPLEVGGGDYLLTEKQKDFIEKYCTPSTLESLCFGTIYYKVAPATSSEKLGGILKDGNHIHGLQFIGADFKTVTYEDLVRN